MVAVRCDWLSNAKSVWNVTGAGPSIAPMVFLRAFLEETVSDNEPRMAEPCFDRWSAS